MSITDTVDTSDAGNGASESSALAKSGVVPEIDLLSCQPEDLASHLLTHRFRNNAMDVASFLLTCTAALPNAEEISAQLMGGGDDDEDDGSAEAEDTESAAAADGATKQEKSTNDTASNNNVALDVLGEPMASFSAQVSCINPRGRFLLSLHNNGLSLTNPKKEEEQITVTEEKVQHMIWFRKPEDYKSLKQLKEGKPVPGHMVLLCLEDGISFRNKALKQICFQLPSYPAPSAESNEDEHNEEDWYHGFSSLLSKTSSITRVLAKMDKQSSNNAKRGGGYMFQAGEGATGNTSSTTEGLPFVGCNKGFNNGALFPLREGLLFFKPPLFVPRSKLASISCGRGSGQSRFVDMVVQLDDESSDGDSTLEFTNIDRDELQGLNGYIHNVLIPAMKLDAAGGSDNVVDEDEDDEEEDVAMAEVVDSSDEGSDSDENSGKNKRKSSRAASRTAREATRAHYAGLNGGNDDHDDDDDDEDSDAESFIEEDGSDSGSDDDGSDVSDCEVADDDEFGEEEESEDSDDGDGSFEEVTSNKKARFD
jgi:hypothetical protein